MRALMRARHTLMFAFTMDNLRRSSACQVLSGRFGAILGALGDIGDRPELPWARIPENHELGRSGGRHHPLKKQER